LPSEKGLLGPFDWKKKCERVIMERWRIGLIKKFVAEFLKLSNKL